MNFYLSFILSNLVMCVYSKNIVLRSDFVEPDLDAVGLQFFLVVNNSLGEDCVVEASPGECCLEDIGDRRCDIVRIIGRDVKELLVDETKTLYLVAPLLEPFERKGYCTIYLDTRPISRLKHVARETVKIKFHTTHKKHETCKYIDEDPLNNCEPVNCVSYYNDKRSFYHPIKKRCVNIPYCYSSINTNSASVTYNPKSNRCDKRPAIHKRDIDFIKTLTHKHRTAKDLTIISLKNPEPKAKPKKEEMVVHQNVLARVGNYSKENNAKARSDTKTLLTTNKNTKLKCFIEYLSTNKYTLIFLTALVMIQCCLICSLLYCSVRSCYCCKDKKVIKKLFHPQNIGACDTTPLISSSNVNTELMDVEYLSESSNFIDKKIKCYKACQKERKNNVKLSMSDDILSKCLTRRDWKRIPRSETIPEAETERIMQKSKPSKKGVKVNFEEAHHIKPRIVKSSRTDTNRCSERELHCHDYDKEASIHAFKESTDKYMKYCNFGNSCAASMNREAQVYFSNDSLDDYLSDRGIIFLEDGNSKFSFTSGSSIGKITESTCSKSKVRRGDSEPVLVNSENLKLLHISPAIGSSSNETDYTTSSKSKASTNSL